MKHLTADNHLASPLWFDQPDAEQQLQAKLRGGVITQAEADLIAKFRTDGFAIVDIGGIDSAIDSLLRGIDRLWADPPFDLASAGPGHERPTPMSEGVTLYGREPGVRLMDIHSHVPGARELYLNEQLHRLCGLLFDGQPIATQSLYFEYGSTQTLHRDPWFVNHDPRSHLLAAWFALEDIHPDSGPLNYVAGSHKLPYFRFKTDDIVFHDPRVSDDERRAAGEDMRRQMAANGLRRDAALPKRGQVFLWHGSLIHGGSPVVNPALTRRSLVVHFGRTDTHLQRGAGLSCSGISRTFSTTRACTNAAGMRGWENPLIGITRADFLAAPGSSKPADTAVLPPTQDDAACPICGGTRFGAGPGGRLSTQGKKPHCLQCGSLEIQRANYRVFAAMPVDFLNWRRALRIGVISGLNAPQFRSLDLLPPPSAGDPESFATTPGQYDLISMNQVFEFVRDDRAFLAEVAHRMTNRSILNVCFSSIGTRSVSTHECDTTGNVYHRYGGDVLSHFNCKRLGLHALAIEVQDGCTGSTEVVHLFMKNLPELAVVRQYLSSVEGESLRLL